MFATITGLYRAGKMTLTVGIPSRSTVSTPSSTTVGVPSTYIVLRTAVCTLGPAASEIGSCVCVVERGIMLLALSLVMLGIIHFQGEDL